MRKNISPLSIKAIKEIEKRHQMFQTQITNVKSKTKLRKARTADLVSALRMSQQILISKDLIQINTRNKVSHSVARKKMVK